MNNPALATARAGIVALAQDASTLFPDPRWDGIISDQGNGVMTSKVTLPGSHGPGSATGVGRGELAVDTPEGVRDVVVYEVLTELEANGTNQATVTITHPASGVKLTTVGRMGDRGVAAISGAAQGRLDVGPASIMPLSLTLADGTTKTWEVVPQAWIAGFESTGLPWNQFPFKAP